MSVKLGRKRNRAKVSPANIFNLMLMIGLYYYSYRYITHYGNAATSGTYFDTPAVIQAVKYILCLFLIGAAFLFVAVSKNSIRTKSIIIVSVLFVFMQSAYSFIVVKNADALNLFMGAFLVACIILVNPNIDLIAMDRIFYVYLVYTTLYELIQIGLYLTRGRLPNIAYANSGIMQVRFGGAVDDPFCFSIMMGFFIPYVFHKFNGRKKWVYAICLVVFLIMTWTLTAIAALAGVFGISKLVSLVKGKRLKAAEAMIFLVSGIGIIIFVILYGNTFLSKLISVKAGSARGHLLSYNIDDLSVWSILGIAPVGHYSESGFLKLLYYGGFLYLIAFLVIGIGSIMVMRKVLKISADNKQKAVLYGMYYYQICYMVASLNVPYIFMFLPALLFSMFAGCSFVMYSRMKYAREMNSSSCCVSRG